MNKLATMIGAAVAVACAAKAATLDERVEELLSRMTLEEKIGQLWQTDGGKVQGGAASEDLSNAGISEEFLDEVRAGRYGSLIGMRGAKGYNVLQKAATEGRLGIPLLIGHDMIHSARTCFPVPLALSCSWDTNLVERIGEAMAVESLTMGCNWTFAPMLDVALDARWGRIVEGSGSDPFLTSRFGEAWVRGIQGKDMADGRHIAACAKHYVAYGACMGGRDYNAVEMSDDTLRDVYLPPFKAAIDAGVATVMPAFHSFNGVPCSMNRYLLTDILRGEFGFDGMTISDYNAVDEMATGHGVAVQGADAAAKALNAGMDMEMISRNYPTGLAEAVRSGAVDIAVIDEAVRQVPSWAFRQSLHRYRTARKNDRPCRAPCACPRDRREERCPIEECWQHSPSRGRRESRPRRRRCRQCKGNARSVVHPQLHEHDERHA